MESRPSTQNYWIFFLSTISSLLAINLIVYSQGWYILALTGQKLSVGLSFGLFFIPGLFLLPGMKRILDSAHIKRNLILTEVFRAVLMLAFIPILNLYPRVEVMYLLIALFGISFSVFFPAVYVVLKQVAPIHAPTRYVHLHEVAIQVASNTAVLAVGFIYESFGFQPIMAISAVFSLASVILIARLNITGKDTQGSFLNDYRQIGQSIQTAFSRPHDRKFLLFGMAHQFPQNIILVLNIPILLYVYEVLKKGAIEYSILDALFGMGAMIAGLLLAKYHIQSLKKPIVLVSTVCASLALASIAFGPSTSVWPYLLFFLAAGLLTASKLVCRAVIIKNVPDAELPRLSIVFQTLNQFLLVLMFFGTAILSEIVNARVVFAVMSVLILAFSAVLLFLYEDDRVEVMKVAK
jgi:hypothetical protein